MTLKNAMETLYVQLEVAGDRIAVAEKKAIKVMFMDYTMTGIIPNIDDLSELGAFIIETVTALYPVKPKKQPMTAAERQKLYRNNKRNESNKNIVTNVTERYESDEDDDNNVTGHGVMPTPIKGLIGLYKNKREITEAEIFRLNEEVKKRQQENACKPPQAIVAEATLSY